jgi:hypothetical protein
MCHFLHYETWEWRSSKPQDLSVRTATDKYYYKTLEVFSVRSSKKVHESTTYTYRTKRIMVTYHSHKI